MLAGVPSRTPPAARTSAAPADRAGRVTSWTSSTSATPSLTASSTACSAGEGVWWTTSRRGTRSSSPAGSTHDAAVTPAAHAGGPLTARERLMSETPPPVSPSQLSTSPPSPREIQPTEAPRHPVTTPQLQPQQSDARVQPEPAVSAGDWLPGVGGPVRRAWREGTLTRAQELENLAAWARATTTEPNADPLLGAIQLHLA